MTESRRLFSVADKSRLRVIGSVTIGRDITARVLADHERQALLIREREARAEADALYDAAKQTSGIVGGPYYAYIRLPKLFDACQNLRSTLASRVGAKRLGPRRSGNEPRLHPGERGGGQRRWPPSKKRT